MGSLGQIQMVLEERAAELGFDSIELALLSGYKIDWENETFVKDN